MSVRAEVWDRGEDTSRLGSLSDGIFAVALTLLVLDLRLPDPATGTLAAMLVALRPGLWSYGLTFAVVGAFWIAHHRMLRHIAGYTRGRLWVNLLFRALVTVVPFPTNLLGRFNADAADARTAWTVYSVNRALLGLSLFALWRFAIAQKRVTGNTSARVAAYFSVGALVIPAVFLLSIGIYRVSPTAAHISPILIPPVQAAVARVYGRAT